MKIGIQGDTKSFHEAAALQYFGTYPEIVHYGTFYLLFEALRNGEVDHAVVAIANNRFNFIQDTYSMLSSEKGKDFWVCGESYVHVKHQLLGTNDATLESIKEVHSQRPALGQCADFLQQNFPDAVLVEQHDTALSAKLVSEWNDPTKAAIASDGAGKLYDLKVLAPNIQDDPHNLTRFLILDLRSKKVVSEGNKTSIILRTAQVSGSLASALQLFKDAKINIATLHSTFVPNSAFSMQFFMEFDAGLQEERVQQTLDKLVNEQACEVTVLGTYMQSIFPLADVDKIKPKKGLLI